MSAARPIVVRPRLRVSKGVHNDSTVIGYGAAGVGQCLPTSVTEPGNLTSTMGYGSLTVNDKRTSRPTTVTGPEGIATTVTMDTLSWNTNFTASGADTTRYFFNSLGRPDSTRTGAGIYASGAQYRYDAQGRVIRQ